MDVTRWTARRAGSGHPGEGFQFWVVLACLALTALACFLVLRVTISMMSDAPVLPEPTGTLPAR